MMMGIWVLALLGIGVWSLVSWAIHALLGLDPAQLGNLKPLIAQWPYADELDLWLPGWQRLVQFALDITQNLLAGIHSAAPWIAWAVWGIGCGMVVFVAAVATMALVLYRKAAAASNQPRRADLPPVQR